MSTTTVKAAEPQISIGASELKDLLSTIITEARKPVVTEKELREQASQQDERKANAALVKQKEANQKRMQAACTHKRRDGTTRAVFAKGQYLDFMICQYCQAKIRPGQRPATDDGDSVIYDTALFQELFQLAGEADFIE